MLTQNTDMLNTLLRHKNFSLLLVGYALYIIQLILVMTDDGINYKTIIYEILVFFALLALREYQHINPPENPEADSPPNEPVSSEQPEA